MKPFDGNGMVPVYKVLKEFMFVDYSSMLRFCLSNPYITTVDAGVKYVEEYEADVKVALGTRYDGEEIKRLKTETDRISQYRKNICRECMHCLEKFECPNKLDFPGILSIYSRYTITQKLGKDITSFKEQYKDLDINGTACPGANIS